MDKTLIFSPWTITMRYPNRLPKRTTQMDYQNGLPQPNPISN